MRKRHLILNNFARFNDLHGNRWRNIQGIEYFSGCKDFERAIGTNDPIFEIDKELHFSNT